MEPKRVVITGMGIISSVGNDIQTYWKNLVDGVCGIDYVEDFKDMPVTIAGKVKEFDPEKYGMDKVYPAPPELKAGLEEIPTPMFGAASFTTAKTQKHPSVLQGKNG